MACLLAELIFSFMAVHSASCMFVSSRRMAPQQIPSCMTQ